MPHKSVCTTFNELLTIKPLSSQWLDIESLNKATHKRLSELPPTSEFSQVTQSLMSLSVTADCFISNSLPIRYVDQLVLPNVNKLYCNWVVLMAILQPLLGFVLRRLIFP